MTADIPAMKPSDLRGILTYIPRFRGGTFVIAMDGGIVAHENFSNILLDIAVLRSLNIRIVIVHGAARQVRDISAEMGIPITNADGTGVTDANTLKVSLMAANRITHEVMEGLNSADIRSCYASAIIAHPFGIIGGKDYLLTGRVEKVDAEFLQGLLDKDITPVIPPLGFDGDGRTFRVNSDGVATEVAKALKAAKLIFLTACGGLTRQGEPINQMSLSEAQEYEKKHRGEIPPELVSKVEHALRACADGVSRVHLIDGRQDEALLSELFSHEGVGTMIYANEYTAIRPALKKDVRNLLALIKSSVRAEELVKRTRQTVLAQIHDYYVFEIDRNIAGCVALHAYEGTGKIELACLYVSPQHENQGIGSKLMLFAEARARELGARQMLALSTHAFNYLQQKGGFREGSMDDLPPERRDKYEGSGRNSKILVKDLEAVPPPLVLP